MSELQILNLGADPHERGLVHGRTFPDQIRENVEIYLNRFEMAGSPRDSVVQGGHDWARRIMAFDEEYAIEMAGVAEGSGLPLEQIAVLNARYELTYLSTLSESMAAMTPVAPVTPTELEDRTDGCTAFAALPEVTHDGGTMIGQNWDWLADLRGQCFVMRVTRPDRPNFICLTQAGIVGGAASYEVDGEQYVAVVAGQSRRGAGYWAPNFARLLVYKLGSDATLPEMISYTPPELNPPANFGDAELLALGETHYNAHCASCHGNNGRVSSLFPDLKYAAALNSSALFNAIVIDGALQNNGMVSFSEFLTTDDADAVRAYVVSLSNDAKDNPPQFGNAPAPAPEPEEEDELHEE